MRTSLPLTLILAFLMLSFCIPRSYASECLVTQYNPCEPPPNEVLAPFVRHHPHYISAKRRVAVTSRTVHQCIVTIDDNTAEGPFYAIENHAQIRIEGGPSDGWFGPRVRLQKGRNTLAVPCSRISGAGRIAVWLFGNQETCRYIDMSNRAPEGWLDADNPIWFARN